MRNHTPAALLTALGVVLSVASAASAWNSAGHMVVAEAAWQRLPLATRRHAAKILKGHPHLVEYLEVNRPAQVDADEWIFLRAATWPDWVRTHHKPEYHHGPWHYINLPIVHAGEEMDAPSTSDVNIITAILDSEATLAAGSRADRAVALCWLLHLIGDIHQPLHCSTYYAALFPEGDRGGNRSLVWIGTREVQLHKFWDGLLGSRASYGSIARRAHEVLTVLVDNSAATEELDRDVTPEAWAQESLQVARDVAYFHAELLPANSDDDPEEDEVPEVPDDYATKAGSAAKVAAGKAALRLVAELQRLLE